MSDLIERKPLYELAARLEAEALDEASKLIEKGRVGEVTSEDWRIWSAVLAERTAFKQDVFDAPSAEPEIVRCEDCKHLFDGEHNANCCEVLMRKAKWLTEITVDMNWSCADGERRTDDCI